MALVDIIKAKTWISRKSPETPSHLKAKMGKKKKSGKAGERFDSNE